jgi:type II secretory pathway component PulF
MRKKKAQSILEYTIILAAVVAGIIFAARTIVRPAVEQGFQDASNGMTRMTGAFNNTLGGGN